MKKLFLMLCSLSLVLLASCNNTTSETVNNDITYSTNLINENFETTIDTTSITNTDIQTSNDNLLNIKLLSLLNITDDMKVYKSNQYQTVDDITYNSIYGYTDIDYVPEYIEGVVVREWSPIGNNNNVLPVSIKNMPNSQFCIVDDYIYYIEVYADGCVYNHEIYRSDKYGFNVETIVSNNTSTFYILGNYLLYANINSNYDAPIYTFYNIDTKESISMSFLNGILNVTNEKIYFHDGTNIYYYDFKSKTIGELPKSISSSFKFSENYLYSYNGNSVTISDMLGNILNKIELPFKVELQDREYVSYKDMLYILDDTTIYSLDLSNGEITNQYSIEIPNVDDMYGVCFNYVNDTDIYFSCYSDDFPDRNYNHLFKLNFADLSIEFIGKWFIS